MVKKPEPTVVQSSEEKESMSEKILQKSLRIPLLFLLKVLLQLRLLVLLLIQKALGSSYFKAPETNRAIQSERSGDY